jgi:hypothetical protein
MGSLSFVMYFGKLIIHQSILYVILFYKKVVKWCYKNRNPLPIMVGHAIIDVATALQIVATSAIPGFYEMMCRM